MECVGCLGSANDLVAEVRGRDPRPDVAVLDANMPGRDPMQAMKELTAEWPSTRTIIYSAHDGPAFISRARDAGAWGCVSKHAEPKELVRAVRDVAAGRPAWPGRSASEGQRHHSDESAPVSPAPGSPSDLRRFAPPELVER
jgi:DNA-binding NarL/FixJ family response regulator